jgi:hypothetical protein
MHGLVNRAIQCFLRDTYGEGRWADIAVVAGAPPEGFEAMLRYPDATTTALLDAAAARLDTSRESILEDIGNYLVSHPNTAALRRMLRFGGVTFADFLHSLEDLPGRARLAVPDLELPALELDEDADGALRLYCRQGFPGVGLVLLGLLRALADDYGALSLFDHAVCGGGVAEGDAVDPAEVITIRLADHRFAAGRGFSLAAAG